jgi:uncharacterized membrane protein
VPESVAWNLLLAVIPVVLGYGLAALLRRGLRPAGIIFLAVPLAVAWIGFLPNTCYLLTEWRHLLFDKEWESMLDTATVDLHNMYRTAKWSLYFLGYSFLGVATFVLSIRPVEHWLFFFLVSLGVYLGLIKRMNSWDLLHRPQFVWNLAVEGVTYVPIVTAISVFAVILWIMYEAVDLWIDAFRDRLGLGRGAAPKPGRAAAPAKPVRKKK